MKIGDLWVEVKARLQGFDRDVTTQATKTGAKAGKNLSASMSKSMGSAKTGILQGLGLGAGLGVVGLASTAIGKLTDIVGDSIRAFNEDQVSVQKMGTALRAAIPGWDGNTDAIEKMIASRTKLGFSDDQQRVSLAKLAAATHDVNKALDLQRIAMDLARFSGTSLEEASASLVKVQAGQFRALKALGIVLPKTATAMDALAAIQKVVTGGAEDYAKTNEGKVLASQVKVNEKMESLGGILAGPVAEGTVLAADGVIALIGAIVDLSDAFGALDKAVVDFSGGTDKAAESTDFLGSRTTALGGLLHTVADALSGVLDETAGGGIKAANAMKAMDDATRAAAGGVNTLDDAVRGARTPITAVGGALDDLTTDVDDNAFAFDKWKRTVTASSADVRRRLTDDANALIDDVFDPLIAANELHALKVERNAEREILASSKSTAAQKRDASDRLLSLDKDINQTRLKLMEAGALSAKERKAWLADLEKRSKTATGKAKRDIDSLISKIRELALVNASGVKVTVGNVKRGQYEVRDAGGPTVANRPYLIGLNRRPEIMAPGAGRVLTIPQAEGVAALVGGGSTRTNNVTINNPEPRAAEDDVGRTLRRLEWLGY